MPKPELKSYTSKTGQKLLYCGNPDLSKLENLADGPADLWHSGPNRGLKNAFPELIYQTSVFWWYLNDFDNVAKAVSWRISPHHFVVRESVWERLGGFDDMYESDYMTSFAFGINLLRNHGGIPMHIKGLFPTAEEDYKKPSILDRYKFFRTHFKQRHSIYMLLRKRCKYLFSELSAYLKAKLTIAFKTDYVGLPIRELNPLSDAPKVSVVIPTMYRQDYTLQLLKDYKMQTYPISEAIVVDATPEAERDDHYYNQEVFPFKLTVKWQTTQGSCRARNEAIELCTGDYIIFGDDDIRIPPDFVEKHIRLLQTYNAKACNGLDISAEHHEQDLEDLKRLAKQVTGHRTLVGAASSFSNANSCVAIDVVRKLVGNDINYDGGYGEDGDFGMSISKLGIPVLHNPLAKNLHLKPPSGGYRWWASQAKILGKNRKQQPWELNNPVKGVVPKPSPTVMYQIVKHFPTHQLREYKHKYFFLYLFKGSIWKLPLRFIKLPIRLKQFKKSVFYAKQLKKLGVRHQ